MAQVELMQFWLHSHPGSVPRGEKETLAGTNASWLPGFERDAESLGDVPNEMGFHLLTHFLRNFCPVTAVLVGQNIMSDR